MARQWRRRAAVAAVSTASALAMVLASQPAFAAHGTTSPGRSSGLRRPAALDGQSGATSTPHAAARSANPATHTNVPNELLAKTFAEGDDDDQGGEPTVNAQCVDELGSPNPYRNPAPNVDVVHGDTTVAAGSQLGCQAAQNETTIAVNPFNPNNLVSGANDYRVFNTREGRNDGSGFAYTTFDGGRTWTDVQLPHLTFQTGATGALSDMDSAGDPSIAFGPHNTVYYANLVFSRLNAGTGLTMSVSHDGGRTFGEPSIVELDGVNPDGTPADTDVSNDKEWVTADPTSGTVYVTWTSFNSVDSPIMVRKSTDFGRTWGAAVRVSPSSDGFSGGITAFDQGSNPVIGNDGTLYIAYEASVCQTLACDQPTDHDAVVVATSRNGGRTFKNVEVSLDFDFPTNEDVGRQALTGLNFRINSFPQMTIDRLTGRLWVTWSDDRNGTYNGFESIKTNGDNFVTSSSDGTHWSGLTTVGTADDEVYGAIAALGGRVVVSSYTRHYDPAGINLDYAMWKGWGAGIGSGRIQRITTVSEDPNVQFVGVGLVTGTTLQGEFIGDYSAIAIGADFKVHPTWTDFRGKPGTNTPNQDVYTQSLSAF
jgi:hypothetical protein